jgi:hypothetical protein
MSSTVPCWSTARHRERRWPLIVRNTSSSRVGHKARFLLSQGLFRVAPLRTRRTSFPVTGSPVTMP